MAYEGEFLTIEEAANTLGVSVRHARRLADAGSVVKVARGLIDRVSVDRYIQSQRLGRTRAWAEHTAWGAIALLAGQEAGWLGATQRSRLRGALRDTTDPHELLARTRDRAQVHRFVVHRAAIPRIRERVAIADLRQLGLADSHDESIDGYLSSRVLDEVVDTLVLQEDSAGDVVLRATAFNFERVADLVGTSVVAALDAATSTDPRVRGVGQSALTELLGAFE